MNEIDNRVTLAKRDVETAHFVRVVRLGDDAAGPLRKDPGGDCERVCPLELEFLVDFETRAVLEFCGTVHDAFHGSHDAHRLIGNDFIEHVVP